MISFETLVKELEELLNTAAASDNYGLTNGIVPNTLYRFSVKPDTAKYKGSERTGNSVTSYINAVMSVIGDSTEGISNETYNAVMQTRVEFLIPLTNEERSDNDLLSAVRALIQDTLKLTSHKYIEDEEDGVIYLRVVDYDIPTSGIRDQRLRTGDSISLPMYITYSFIAEGVSSDSFQLYLVTGTDEQGNEVLSPVRYEKFGMARRTVADPNSESSTTVENGVPGTKNVPTATVLTMNVDMNTRLYPIDEAARIYRRTGQLVPLTFKVVEITDTNGGTVSDNYTMIFDTVGQNMALGLPSTTSLTFVEYLPPLTS